MKHLYKLAIAIIFIAIHSANATNVSGNVYGHWTLANSPYNVVNNINIPSDSTLIIDAGVDVTFNANYEMKIDGRVLAIGNVSDSISFTAPNLFPGFAGIRFEVTNATQDSSIFEYCFVKNANRGTQFLTGMDNYGGAFLINNFNKVRIQNCSITYCKAFDAGAGICIYNSSNIAILDNYIAYNNALDASSSVNDGGGIYCKGNSSPIISRNEISYNTASGRGGAIYVSGGSPQINNNLITRNNIYPCWFTGNCNVNFVNNILTFNNLTNGNIGPPISINQAINVLIQNNTITNNVNSSYSGFLKGGGIYVGTATNILIKGNTITKNSLSVSTSGYVLEGGGIYCNTTNKAYIINNFISNNTGAANGGGVYIKNGFLINNVICNNMALGGTLNDGKGGGVCLQDTVVLINNTIANNYAKKGGGVYINGRRNSKMFNCIVWGNDVSSSGSGRQVYCNNTQTLLNYTIKNCDIDSGQAKIGLQNNNLQGMIYQNNIDTIPGFVNPTDTAWVTADATLADWTLLNSSACINTGDSTLVSELTDIAGNDRVYDTNVDMGAYEYQSLVLNLPSANFILSNDSICANSSFQLQNMSSNASSYSWTFQDGIPATSSAQNPSVLWNTSGQKIIKLVVANNSGVDSLSQIITVNPLPIASTISALGNTTFCAGGSVMLMGNIGGTWNNGSTAADINVSTAGNYYVVLSNNCGDDTSNIISINLESLPTPNILVFGNILTVDTAMFATYQWQLNGVDIPNENTYSYTATQTGNYSVVVTSANGCSGISPVENVLITSVSNLNKLNLFSLFPSPTNSVINIAGVINQKLEIQNTLGQTIFSKQNSNTLETIDVSGFVKGVYFVRVNNTSMKFIKE